MPCSRTFLFDFDSVNSTPEMSSGAQVLLVTPMQKQVKQILVVRFSSLGDVVLTTPVLGALKAKFPRSRIFFLTKAQYADLVRNDPRISHLIEFDPERQHKGLTGLMNLISQLRRYEFDLLIDLHANLRSFLVRRLVKSKGKLKYDKRWLSRFLMVHLKFLKTEAVHTVDSYLEALGKIPVEVDDKNPTLFLGQDDGKFAEHFLLERNVEKHDIVVGLHPGARWETKRWDEARFAQACRTLIERLNCKVLLFGDSSEEKLVEDILKELPKAKVLKVVGLSLGALMALIQRCACLVTNDSGPMHIASALSVPVVAIFGPTHPRLGFAPLGSKGVMLCADVECSPCSLHGEKSCRKKAKPCMDLIQPEMVVEAVKTVLEEKESLPKGT